MGDTIFEIALVGAGAVSAGAYTGGVIDFRWWRSTPGTVRRDTTPAVPHEVSFPYSPARRQVASRRHLRAQYLGSDLTSSDRGKTPRQTRERTSSLTVGSIVSILRFSKRRDLKDEHTPVHLAVGFVGAPGDRGQRARM